MRGKGITGTRGMASKMRHRVTIQRPKNNPDGLGGVSEGWEDVATLWALINPARSSEEFIYGGNRHTVTHKIIVRHNPDQPLDFNQGLRAVFGARNFRLHGARTPLEIPGSIYEISATEGVAT